MGGEKPVHTTSGERISGQDHPQTEAKSKEEGLARQKHMGHDVETPAVQGNKNPTLPTEDIRTANQNNDEENYRNYFGNEYHDEEHKSSSKESNSDNDNNKNNKNKHAQQSAKPKAISPSSTTSNTQEKGHGPPPQDPSSRRPLGSGTNNMRPGNAGYVDIGNDEHEEFEF